MQPDEPSVAEHVGDAIAHRLLQDCLRWDRHHVGQLLTGVEALAGPSKDGPETTSPAVTVLPADEVVPLDIS